MDIIYNAINYMDCFDGIDLLDNDSVNLVMTSPPYAMQRVDQYGGVSEIDYPDWTLNWVNKFRGKLTEDGSICINIRPNIKNGEISDYVLKTRILLRENGWIECEELIWIKPGSPPLGSRYRPRRSWESVLWFSKSGKPKCNPKANGRECDILGFVGTTSKSLKNKTICKNNIQCSPKTGVSRCEDYIVAAVGGVEKGYNHPAMFPPKVPEYIIKMMTDEGDLVVDPFIGSGTTGRVAQSLNRRWIGFEINSKYAIDDI